MWGWNSRPQAEAFRIRARVSKASALKTAEEIIVERLKSAAARQHFDWPSNLAFPLEGIKLGFSPPLLVSGPGNGLPLIEPASLSRPGTPSCRHPLRSHHPERFFLPGGKSVYIPSARHSPPRRAVDPAGDHSPHKRRRGSFFPRTTTIEPRGMKSVVEVDCAREKTEVHPDHIRRGWGTSELSVPKSPSKSIGVTGSP